MIIHTVEQGTGPWLEARLGLPSASNFKKILTSTGKPSSSQDDYMLELCCERLSGKPTSHFVNDDMQRGLDLENEAVETYEFINGTKTTVVGWVTDNDQRYGCSPDRMNLEVKCPRDKNHIKWKLGGKVPPDHLAQVQGCMWICEEDHWDFMSYNQDLGHFICRAERDDKWIGLMEAEMEKFLRKIEKAMKKLKEIS